MSAPAAAPQGVAARLQSLGGRLSLSGARLPLLLAAVALAAALVQAPRQLHRLQGQATTWESLSADGAALDVARRLDIEPDLLQAARRLIPPTATVAIQTGAGYQSGNPTALAAVFPFYRFYLLPRRTVDVSQAEWLVCFACDSETARARGRIVWQKTDTLYVARLRRP